MTIHNNLDVLHFTFLVKYLKILDNLIIINSIDVYLISSW